MWVEALGDVAIRLAPIGREDAMDMIGEIRGSALLRGLRGAPPADVEAIADILLSVSRLIVETPEIQELDLNPVMVWRDKAAALDVRMMLGTAPDVR